jgi:RNA polymerase subunit RPABC4/transcription elongation factor Spt4
MSRFGDGLRIIPGTAKAIAGFVYLVAASLTFFFAIPSDNHMRDWQLWQKLLFCGGIYLFVVAWILLIGYVYADAKRRGMRYVMWTWLAALIPDAIGVILYFILRDALPRPCHGCGTVVKAGYTFCPHCGAAMQPTCPQCGKGVEGTWSNCPHCGSGLPSQARAV